MRPYSIIRKIFTQRALRDKEHKVRRHVTSTFPPLPVAYSQWVRYEIRVTDTSRYQHGRFILSNEQAAKE